MSFIIMNKGEIDHFDEGLWPEQETGLHAKYSIYDIINKLKKDSIDLIKHDVMICYTDFTQRRGESSRHEKHYWIVAIDYHDENKRILWRHKQRISPYTGEVLEDWIEEW